MSDYNIRSELGVPLEHAEVDANFLLSRFRVAWENIDDAATAVTPIDLAVAGQAYPITNDAAGAMTITGAIDTNVGQLWNPATQLFDLSGLEVGDFLLIRYDLLFTPSGGGEKNVDIQMRGGIGGVEFTVPMGHDRFGGSPTQEAVGNLNLFFIGSENTRTNGARLEIVTDNAGAELEVNGWWMGTIKLNRTFVT